MRDRIPCSASDPFAGSGGELMPQAQEVVSTGRRLRVRVPENLAVIRSGQDWGACGDRELAEYDTQVRPVLLEGMRYLAARPYDTGCCDMRFAREIDVDGSALPRAFGLGYFLTLAHLERWAENHPTHLAIFNRFLEMAGKLGRFDLCLWHEVAVLPAVGQTFEYVNCQPWTGLLPYFPAQEL
jgi:hypothetical protein